MTRTLRAALAATSGFAVGYLLPGPLQLPTLLYDPVNAHAFIGVNPGGMVMRYYGDLLTASIAALCAAAVSWKVQRQTPLGIAGGMAMSLVALDVAFYLSRLLAAV